MSHRKTLFNRLWIKPVATLTAASLPLLFLPALALAAPGYFFARTAADPFGRGPIS